MALLHWLFLAALGVALGSLASTATEVALDGRLPRFEPAARLGVERGRSLDTPRLMALLGLPAPSTAPPEEELPQPRIVGTLAPTFAAIIDDGGHMRTLSVGEAVGEAEVVLVEHFAVLWRHRGRLFRSEVAHPASRRSPSPSPGAITLPRSALEGAIGSFPEIIRTVQVVPVFSGQPLDAAHRVFRGFRLQHLDPQSILGAAGLAKGDVIERLNGLDLSRPDNLARLLALAPTVDHIEIDLNRDGQPRHLSIEVSP